MSSMDIYIKCKILFYMKTKQKRKIGKRIEEYKQKLEKTVEKTLFRSAH
jgi:hypothetical protein